MKTQNVSRSCFSSSARLAKPAPKAEVAEPVDQVTLSSPPPCGNIKTHQRVCFKAAVVLGLIAAGYGVLGAALPAFGDMLPQFSLLSGLSATAAHAVTAATPFALWSAGLGLVALSERKYAMGS